MNYYDLPQDILEKIQNIIEEEELIDKCKKEWAMKMIEVNAIFNFACDVDAYAEGIEEGKTFREILDDLGLEEHEGLTFRGMEYAYFNTHLPYMRKAIQGFDEEVEED